MNARPLFHEAYLAYYTAVLSASGTSLMATSRRQAQCDLEAVIDKPLKRGERANHGNPHR